MNPERFFLHPGAIKVSSIELEIITVLGTCIAVCLFDNVNKVGGMNHFLLPEWDSSGLRTPRYGNVAIPQLIHEMEKLGAQKKHIKAKVFGGMIKKDRNLEYSVGKKNIEYTFRKMEELGIQIVAYDVGEPIARKLLMNTKTGGIKLKRIKDE